MRAPAQADVMALPLTSAPAATASGTRRAFDLVRLIAARQVKLRYRGSMLGVLWSFANPLLMTAIYTAIFGTAFARYYGGSRGHYVVSSFVAVALVTYFLQATSEALVTVAANGGLLNKVPLQPQLFPLAAVAANTFQQLVTTFPLIVIVSALTTHDPLRVALVPLVLAAFVAMVAGFSLALAALYVFFRDLAYLWGVAGFVLWLTSPVFYPPEVVPAAVRAYVRFNPIAIAIGAVRQVAIERGPLDLAPVAGLLACAAGAVAIGVVVFRSTRRSFMDLV